VYADRAYDALSVAAAIEAKGRTPKVQKAKKLEAHKRPLKTILARIEKSSAPGSAAIVFLRCAGLACESKAGSGSV
jgi:hypothetical protein